jgi:O-antigen/teichoic acid export membrane protein
MGSYVLLQLLRIASSLVLTRLLMPEMFGVMAVATMVQVAVAMLSDVGLRPAAIQSRMGDEPRYLDTAWSLQLAHGIVIWLVCSAIAWGIAVASSWGWFPAGSVYAEPALPMVIAVLCFVTVISGLQSTKIITAYRELNLARITAIELVAQLISLAVAVLLAWYTRSLWSFVAAAWCSAVVSTVLSHCWLKGHRNHFALDREAVGDLIQFGKWVLLSSAFTVLAANGDKILLAGWITPTMLGLYALGFSLVAMLEGAGSRLFSSVAMPALSRVNREDPQRLATVFLKLRLPFDVAFVCAAGAMYAMGANLINLLYDERYAGAAVVLEILSFGLVIARFGVISNVYLAIGEPRHLTLLNLVRALSVITLVPIGYSLSGFEGALWAIALHGLPGTVLLWYLNRRHHLNSFALEVATLGIWPLGYAGGWLASWIIVQTTA